MEKKLLFVINHYSPASDQHLFHVLNLVREIAQRGVKIALVIERCEGAAPDLGEGIEVYAQKHRNKALRMLELTALLEKLCRNGYKKIFVRISKHAAAAAIIAAKLHHGETYFWHSGQGLELMDELPADSAKQLEKGRRDLQRIGMHVDHFVTGPETMLEYYVQWCKIPREKMTLLYNDVDLKRFCPIDPSEKQRLRAELGLENEKKYVLFVHRFSPIRKNTFYIPYCIEKAALSDVKFLLIGNGPEETAVREAVAEAGLRNVTFLGGLPNKLIQKYYQACDVFVNPSYCEGFPRVIIEAMACGMPIVATNAGGTEDILSGVQRQFVVDVRDRDLLAEKLRELVSSDELQKECAECNLERVKRYSTEKVAEMYINAFWPEDDHDLS